MAKTKQAREKMRNTAWSLFDAVEKKQRETEKHSDPTLKDYVCDEDVVDLIEEYLVYQDSQSRKEVVEEIINFNEDEFWGEEDVSEVRTVNRFLDKYLNSLTKPK